MESVIRKKEVVESKGSVSMDLVRPLEKDTLRTLVEGEWETGWGSGRMVTLGGTLRGLCMVQEVSV